MKKKFGAGTVSSWDEGYSVGRYGGEPDSAESWNNFVFKQAYYHGKRVKEQFDKDVLDEMVGYVE